VDPAAARRVIEVLSGDEPQAFGAVAPDPHDPGIPGFTVDRLVGRGGGGAVYRAFRRGSDRAVALKVLDRPLGSSDSAKRAWRELDLLVNLRAPCVPRVLDYGVHAGRMFIATEFVDGATLTAHADSNELSVRERAELMARVADAVQSLHERGVIHRDLKPANILITGDGDPVLVDLGVAALLEGAERADATLTIEGQPVGTPAYMSPEQARGDSSAVSTRSDVYGLGATAYALFTGEPPHDTGGSVHEALHRVSHDEPRPARSLNPSLPAALEAVLLRAVAPDPSKRYASASAFAEDLRRFARGDPVEAQPPSVWQRGARWAGRHPIAFTGFVSALILLSTALASWGVIWWALVQPASVVVTNEGREAQLVTAGGKVLRTWRSTDGQQVLTAKLVERPEALGGGRVVVTHIVTKITVADDAPYSERVCVWDARDTRVPLWFAPSDRDWPTPPREPQESDGTYGASHAIVADVFPGAAHPGDEIIVIMVQHASPALVRVYDLAGTVLFEAWHRGSIHQPCWLKQSRTLVAFACDNRFRCGVSVPSTENQVGYPVVIMGLRPVAGERWGLINQEDLTQPRAAWYLYVVPREGSPADWLMWRLIVSLDDRMRGDAVDAMLRFADQSFEITWVVKSDGTPFRCFANDWALAQHGPEVTESVTLSPEVPWGLVERAAE